MISVVIPTAGNLPRRERLIDVIDSVANQSVAVGEVLLVWQGDDDKDFFDQLPSLVTVVFQKAKATSQAKNNGAAKATGDFLLFLDDDTTFYSKNDLEHAVSTLKNKKLDFVIANIECQSSLKPAASIENTIWINNKTLKGNFWEPGIVIRRELFNRFQFDETLGVGCLHGASEGFDLGARLIAAGCKGLRLHDYVLVHPALDNFPQDRLFRMFWYSLGNSAALISNRYYRWYFLELVKSIVKLGLACLRLDWLEGQSQAVRFLCFLLGPLVPRKGPMGS